MNKFYLTFTIFVLLILSVSFGFGQDPQPNPTPPPLEEVIRISSELVLVDAVVLDEDGNQVTDLTPDDFEVYQDGELQEITNFAYLGRTADTEGKTEQTAETSKKIPPPPISVRLQNQGRVITFVVDNGGCATPEAIANARHSLRKFVQENMLPGDKIAIYTTRSGSSLLQLYTSNREILLRKVDKIRWTPSRCVSAFDPVRDFSKSRMTEGSSGSFESAETKAFKDNINREDRANIIRGTISVLGFVVDRLKVLPERKVVFFISEGLNISNDLEDSLIWTQFRELTDKASRASVAFYTVNSLGVTYGGSITAQDEVLPGIPGGEDDNTGNLINERLSESRFRSSSLAILADQTGGEYLGAKAFLSGVLEKVLDKENGYYLLGYQPASDTFKGKEFHEIKIKLKRPGLKILSRKGFLGREDRDARPRYRNSNNPLYEAIASPFTESEINLRLTTLVGNDSAKGSYIRSLVHIDGENLTFSDEPNGMKKTVLDVVAVTLDEKGEVIEEFNHTYPIRIPAQGLETIRKNGLDYTADMPVKKSGIYTFRLAIRDVQSKRLASAGDFVEVPKLKKNKMFMSGLITTNADARNKPNVPQNRPAEKAFAPIFSQSIPSIRKHKIGTDLHYTFEIYNAKPDKSSGKPILTKQLQIYRDGKLLLEGKEVPIEIKDGGDPAKIRDSGVINLNRSVQPGEYILQIIVRDKSSDKIDSQWIDFEIIG